MQDPERLLLPLSRTLGFCPASTGHLPPPAYGDPLFRRVLLLALWVRALADIRQPPWPCHRHCIGQHSSGFLCARTRDVNAVAAHTPGFYCVVAVLALPSSGPFASRRPLDRNLELFCLGPSLHPALYLGGRVAKTPVRATRSEERRVGKEC